MPTDASMSSATETAAVRRYTDLPGPPQWPVVGNLLQIAPGRLHRQLEGWADRYGSAFQLRFGRRRILVMTEHGTIGTVLRDRPDRFNRPVHSGMALREMGLQVGLFSANGDMWRRQRRMVMAGFDPGHVKDYFPSLLRVAQRLQGRWRQAADRNAGIDLQADLMRFTVDAIAGLAFGSEVNTLQSDEDVIQRHLEQDLPGPVPPHPGAGDGTGAMSGCRRIARSTAACGRCARRSGLHRPGTGSDPPGSRSAASIRATCSRR